MYNKFPKWFSVKELKKNDYEFSCLCLMDANKYLLPEIKTYEDVIKYSYLLKNCFKSSPELFDRILQIVIFKIKTGDRFKRSECLKLLKNLKNKMSGAFSEVIIERIFWVYTELIDRVNDKQAGSLTVLLKNVPLNDQQITWLIHHADNIFVFNRLLTYPVSSQLVASWSHEQLNNKNYSDDYQKSSLMARIIEVDSTYKNKDIGAFAWGIYHSRIPEHVKKELLMNLINTDERELVIYILIKADCVDALERLYQKR